MNVGLRLRQNQLLVKGIVTTGFLFLVLTRVDLAATFASWRRLSIGGFVAGIALYCLAWSIASLKWKLLLPQFSWLELLKINFIGQYYSTIFPGQIAGEAAKAYKLSRGNPDAPQIVASVIIDRITGLLGLLGVALGGIIFSVAPPEGRIIWALLMLVALLFLGLFYLNRNWWSVVPIPFIRRFDRIGSQVAQLFDAWKRYVNHFALLFWNVVLGACFQIVAIIINIRFAHELGIYIGFPEWCWIFGVIALVTMLPFSVAGIGLREGSFVGTLGLVGIAPERAMALSLAVFSLLLVGAGVGAILDWTANKSNTA